MSWFVEVEFVLEIEIFFINRLHDHHNMLKIWILLLRIYYELLSKSREYIIIIIARFQLQKVGVVIKECILYFFIT